MRPSSHRRRCLHLIVDTTSCRPRSAAPSAGGSPASPRTVGDAGAAGAGLPRPDAGHAVVHHGVHRRGPHQEDEGRDQLGTEDEGEEGEHLQRRRRLPPQPRAEGHGAADQTPQQVGARREDVPEDEDEESRPVQPAAGEEGHQAQEDEELVAEGVEEDADLAREAESILAEQGIDNVAVIRAPNVEGAPKHGAYDAIVLQGAVEIVPDAILAQLKDGGRIVALFSEATLGVARLGYKVDGVVSWRFVFNAGAPVLPGFEQARDFAF